MIKSLVLIFFTVLMVSAQDCMEAPEFYRYLAGQIGTGDPESPTIYWMPCDTMIVNKDVEVNVLPNTYLAFLNPNPNNLILVKGKLAVEGTAAFKVRISSSLDSLLLSPTDMRSNWNGILVDSTGQMILKNTILYGAEKPIQAISKEVRIQNSFFPNGKEIVIAGQNSWIIPADPYVESLNLWEKIPTIPSVSTTTHSDKKPGKKSEKPINRPSKSSKSFKSPYLYLGVTTAAALGGGLFLILNNTDKKTLSEEEKFILSKPGLPNSPQ